MFVWSYNRTIKRQSKWHSASGLSTSRCPLVGKIHKIVSLCVQAAQRGADDTADAQETLAPRELPTSAQLRARSHIDKCVAFRGFVFLSLGTMGERQAGSRFQRARRRVLHDASIVRRCSSFFSS